MTKYTKKDPEIEIKAKFSGAEDWNDCYQGSCNNKKIKTEHGTSGALYFVGFIGSLVYWMQAAVGFGAVVTGFLKACVWPAYIVYKLLESFYGIVV